MSLCVKPRKGLILHSGAIGDCLLTLPLAAFIKRTFGLDQMHFMGRLDAVGLYPRRSCIDHVRAMESAPLHRLFTPTDEFTLDDPDRLITAFQDYEQIVSFLGGDHPHFEQNLLLTVHCSHSAQVSVLPMTPPDDWQESVSRFYMDCFAKEIGLVPHRLDPAIAWLSATADDYPAGQDLVERIGIAPEASLAILHPGSGGRHKCWHPENFLITAAALGQNGYKPLFLLGPAEQERMTPTMIEEFHHTGSVASDLSLTEVFQLLTQAELFVGNDSGISHIAGAMGKKTVTIFGPTDPMLYRPLGPAVTIFKATLESFAAFSSGDLCALLEKLNTLL